MLSLKSILGGMAIALMAGSALAQADPRPLSREDAVALRVADRTDALRSFRVEARPAHMIRYPVVIETRTPAVRPKARIDYQPATRWEHKRGNEMWTRAAMIAVGQHNGGLDSVVPRDIGTWCPAYAQNSPTLRRAFWVGMMSALARYESTYNPRAVGGGGLWFGLLQIYPDTARRYGCRARTGDDLKDPAMNLSCAARIMARTVARDRAIALNDGRWRGVAADWGPMTSRAKIAEMAGWTARQDYCVIPTQVRPQPRPDDLMANYTPPRPVDRSATRIAETGTPPLAPTISTMGYVSPSRY